MCIMVRAKNKPINQEAQFSMKRTKEMREVPNKTFWDKLKKAQKKKGVKK